MSNLTAVRERPLIFSGPMVRALLSGAKTMTRRLVKPQPPYGCRYEINGAGDHALCLAGHGAEMLFVPPTPTSEDHRLRCPYGKPGDQLYVKETHAFVTCSRDDPGAFYGPERGIYSDYSEWFYVYYHADPGFVPHDPPNLRPSIHMPRWASRLTLEVTEVRVERLQDISEADARAEGVEAVDCGIGDCDTPYIHGFKHLWDSINGKRPGCSWAESPYVWAVTFKVVANG